MNRKTPCDCCQSELIEMNHNNKLLINGAVDEVYEERCVHCGNLLYGWVKRVKNADVEV